MMVTAIDIAHFQTFGFVLLRRAFEPSPLQKEMDRVMGECAASSFRAEVGSGEVKGQYAPMMTASTPCSLSLLDRFEAQAADLLGGPVLPVRAKGVRYLGGTPWHTDSRHPVSSVGFAAYLEPLDAGSGALRVLPGSHRPPFGDAALAYGASLEASPVSALPGHVIATNPGDVIVFDEHLLHASEGGKSRLQWRVDYVRDPVGSEEEASVRSYFASIFPPDWEGGYDVDQYPSYGPDWLSSGRPSAGRLGALGVYDLAAAQEGFARLARAKDKTR